MAQTQSYMYLQKTFTVQIQYVKSSISVCLNPFRCHKSDIKCIIKTWSGIQNTSFPYHQVQTSRARSRPNLRHHPIKHCTVQTEYWPLHFLFICPLFCVRPFIPKPKQSNLSIKRPPPTQSVYHLGRSITSESHAIRSGDWPTTTLTILVQPQLFLSYFISFITVTFTKQVG